jgi:hypothetical protein
MLAHHDLDARWRQNMKTPKMEAKYETKAEVDARWRQNMKTPKIDPRLKKVKIQV